MRTIAILLILLSGCIVEPSSAMLSASSEPFSFEAKLPDRKDTPLPFPIWRGDAPEVADNAGEKPAPVLPVIEVHGPPGCAPCAVAVKELNATKRYDAIHADITPGARRFADKWNQGGYPVVTFRDRKGDERGVSWRGVADFEIRFNRAMGIKAAPEPRKSPSSVSRSTAAALFYHGQSSGWTWPGDLRRHLVSEHGYSANQVSGMSDAQVIATHDAAHNGTTMRAYHAPRVRHRSHCPDGRCPL